MSDSRERPRVRFLPDVYSAVVSLVYFGLLVTATVAGTLLAVRAVNAVIAFCHDAATVSIFAGGS